MNTKRQLLSSPQKKLIETFLANAGSEYIGDRFTFSQQAKNKTKYFSCKRVGFSIDISDSDLFSLAQQGYLQLYVGPPSIIFTEKTLEKPELEVDAVPGPGNRSADPQSQVIKVDIIQLYVWLIASLIAAGVSLWLLIVGILQVMNNNLTIGVLSGLSTIIPGFLATVFFKNYDKSNKRINRLRSKSFMERK